MMFKDLLWNFYGSYVRVPLITGSKSLLHFKSTIEAETFKTHNYETQHSLLEWKLIKTKIITVVNRIANLK